jgi:hypothetical protein
MPGMLNFQISLCYGYTVPTENLGKQTYENRTAGESSLYCRGR